MDSDGSADYLALMNAAPVPRSPNDEALDILRRIEPVLAAIQADQREMKAEIKEIKGELKGVKSDQIRHLEMVAELRGRVSNLPTIWQIVPVMVAINSAIVALAFGLVALIRY